MKTCHHFTFTPRLLIVALAIFVVVCGLTMFSPHGIAAAQQSGIYTEAQAVRGQALYEARCASCHGLRLEGGSASPLAGTRFLSKWAQGNKTVDELYFITRTQMPYGEGNTMTTQQYIDIVAYLLRVNGWQAGSSELAADSSKLKQVRIVPQGSLKDQAMTAPAGGEAKTGAAGAAMPSAAVPVQDELLRA